ncbi:hypothetical protein CM49_00792 [Paenibacillus sp. P1XP2]|nr:hypothetical protein CM49_00792 [Paenibacillus sp. P1XP2]
MLLGEELRTNPEVKDKVLSVLPEGVELREQL